MGYVKAINMQEISPGAMKKVTLQGKDILLVNLEGIFFALSNTCTHMGGSLVKGRLEGDIVRCPRHGSGFNVKTGKLEVRPKILFIKGRAADIETYSIKIKGDEVWVDVGQI